jgi:hypothetical protein
VILIAAVGVSQLRHHRWFHRLKPKARGVSARESSEAWFRTPGAARPRRRFDTSPLSQLSIRVLGAQTYARPHPASVHDERANSHCLRLESRGLMARPLSFKVRAVV